MLIVHHILSSFQYYKKPRTKIKDQIVPAFHLYQNHRMKPEEKNCGINIDMHFEDVTEIFMNLSPVDVGHLTLIVNVINACARRRS